MSSKNKLPKHPEKLLVRREEVINFMNYMSTDENFCLRVWNTVQAVHERAKAEADAAPKCSSRWGFEPHPQCMKPPEHEGDHGALFEGRPCQWTTGSEAQPHELGRVSESFAVHVNSESAEAVPA